MGHMMDWYNANLLGDTNVSGGALQQALGNMQQQQGMANSYGIMGSGGYYTTTAGTAIRFDPMQSLADQIYMAGVAQKDPGPAPKKAWQKTGVFLIDLRHEIDTWHGDILRMA